MSELRFLEPLHAGALQGALGQSCLILDLHPGALARFIRATAVLVLPAERQEELLVSFSLDPPI
jgi:hypothetical protein